MKNGRIELSTLGVIYDSAGATGASGQIFTKQTNGTQLWSTPSAASPKSIEDFPIGSVNANVNGFGAASNNWAFNGVQFTPTMDITISTASTMSALLTQAPSGNFIFAVYRLVAGGAHTRVAYTASTAFPVAGYITPVVFSGVDVATLTGGVIYIMGMWYGANAPILAGITSAVNTNIKPYIGMLLTNMGTVTSPPPSTITDSSTNETGRMYFKLVV